MPRCSASCSKVRVVFDPAPYHAHFGSDVAGCGVLLGAVLQRVMQQGAQCANPEPGQP